MKIALVDNMNNNFFAFARYLRDLGVDADLYVVPGSRHHFQPQCDTFEDVSKMDWVRTFPTSYHWYNLLALNRKSYEMFRDYDLIVACGYAMGILHRCGIPPDVFIPFGRDLFQMPFGSEWRRRGNVIKRWTSLPLRWWISRGQRQSILDARVVIANPRHGMNARALKQLGRSCLDLGIPMVYDKYSFPPDVRWRFLDDHDFIVFNHSRHIWRSNPYALPDFALHGGNKRNDKGIKAFARFLRTTSFRSPLFVTFEYGPDVADSKRLIADLAIQDRVVWMPRLERKHIMHGLRRASLALDQFRKGLSGIGGVGYEVMASGVPLVTHTNGATTDVEHSFYQSPIVDVLDEDEIFETFVDYERNPQRYRQIGEAAKAWFDDHVGLAVVRRYHELFEALCDERGDARSGGRTHGS